MATQPAGLEGDYVRLDLVQVAGGLGAHAVRAATADEVREALAATRASSGPVVIVVPIIPHANLPPAGVLVGRRARPRSSESDTVQQARKAYEAGLQTQRWFG